MAKTSYQLIPSGLDISYKKTLMSGDRFTFPRVSVKRLFYSRSRLKGLTEKSLLPSLSVAWKGLTSGVQDAWSSAGAEMNLQGFKLFVKDTALRLKNSLTGYSTPSTLHQSKFGRLHIESPANSLKITQLHPLNYWVLKKVTGTRDQYKPVKISESFDLPIEIKINYKSNLEASGGSPTARFYVSVLSHYQGRDIITDCEINFNLISDWTSATASITSVLGLVRGYNAFMEIKNATGDLFVDNIELNHSGHNWARDPYCNDLNQGFTKAFYQVAKHWEAVEISQGAQFDSFFE